MNKPKVDPKISFTVDPETKNMIKALASLQGITIRQWCLEVVQRRIKSDSRKLPIETAEVA